MSLTALGYLRIEDDRGNGIVYGAEVKSINFLNGARHSVYYKRNGANAVLLVGKKILILYFDITWLEWILQNRSTETMFHFVR